MNHIGMDSHITTLEFAVVNEAGQLVKADRVATSVNGFMEFVRTVPQPRTIYMEEGTLAACALETCVRFGQKLVITDPKKNHWISSSGQKDDPIDALKLAQLGRGGYIKEVRHPVGQRRRFRELMIAYHDAVKSTTRIKNKIKAKFRQNGIQCTGATVYSETCREDWKGKLPQEPTLLLILDGLWRQLEQSEQTEKELLAAARVQSKNYPEIKHFQALPGIGFIHAATISAMLETPHRFADKKKVWMYAGLGIMRRSSAGKVYSEKLSTDYNRFLKIYPETSRRSGYSNERQFFPAEISGHDPNPWDRTTPGQINHRQGYAGDHVGDVEKRREVREQAVDCTPCI